jgi:hypothetical protein
VSAQVDQRRRELRLRGQVAMLGALAWIAAAFGLPAPVAAIPIALAALALSQFVLLLRLGRPTSEPETAGQRRIAPDIIALAAVALAGLVILLVRLAT